MKRYFADYLNDNPDIAKELGIFSGSQATKQLKNTIKDEAHYSKGMAREDAEALKGINPKATYDIGVGLGDVDGDVVPALHKNKIKETLDFNNKLNSQQIRDLQHNHRNPYNALNNTIVNPIDHEKIPRYKKVYKYSKYFANYLDAYPKTASKLHLISGRYAKGLMRDSLKTSAELGKKLTDKNYYPLKTLNPNATYYLMSVKYFGTDKLPRLDKGLIKDVLDFTKKSNPKAIKELQTNHANPYKFLNHTIAKPIDFRANNRDKTFKPHESTDEKEYKNRSKFNRDQSNTLTKGQILAVKRNQSRHR